MTVREVTPPVDTGALLAGAQFADAFCVEVRDNDLDARHAAERMMARQPRWAEALLTLRNLLVAPLGLKTSGAGLAPPRDMIGIFPVVSQTPDRLIAGFNDRHPHNWLGRTYLAIIMPFHRLIVPALLRQVPA